MYSLDRIIAILIEIGILTAITYAVLNGSRQVLFDLGLVPKYQRAITLAFLAVGSIAVVFFIAHLFTFYPTVN